MTPRSSITAIQATFVLATLALGAALAACGSDDNNGTKKDDVNEVTQSADVTTDTSQAPDTTPTEVAAETSTPPCTLGTACDDDDPCTIDDACDAAGACKGKAKCEDGLACTSDACADGTCTNALLAGFCLGGDADVCVATGGKDPANTCHQCAVGAVGNEWIELGDGASCSDGSVCTTADKCASGVCVGGPPLQCPTDTPCVARACDAALGCVDTNTTAACDDQDPCTVGDACAGGKCKAGTGAAECDDKNPCTIDSCRPGVGCFFDAESKCDDKKPCTTDSCNIATGVCSNPVIEAGGACDDGDPCTDGETCDAAQVCGGGSATVCDDANECTLDTCVSNAGGCLNLFLDQPCDDGEVCTDSDRCVAGVCFGGKDTQTCPFCPVERTEAANKIVSLEVMSDGRTGSGLDLDDDPTTCAPEGFCGGGVDNALAVLAGIMNPGIGDSIDRGVVKWIVDLRNATLDGTPFEFAVYDSGLQADNFDCDFQNDNCEYDIAQLSFDPECRPYFKLGNAKIDGDTLTAGGTGDLIRMVLPLQGGALLGMTIANARTEATITTNGQGKITSMNGIIAGAIPKAQLIEAVEGLPESSLPVDKQTALELLDIIVVNDIDLDGDGLDEAASVAMRIRTIPAIIWGSE